MVKPKKEETMQPKKVKKVKKVIEPITVAEMAVAVNDCVSELVETPRQTKNRLYSELGRLSGLRMLKIVENEDIKEIDKEIANKKTEIELVIQATATLRS